MPTATNVSQQSHACWPQRYARRLSDWAGLTTDDAVPPRLSHRRFAAIVASHSAGHPEFSSLWRRRLQMALLRCKAAGQVVIVTHANPIGPWVELFAHRLDVPHLRIELSERKANQSTELADPCGNVRGGVHDHLRLKRRTAGVGDDIRPALARLPLADRTVAALADEIWAIEVRPNSKTAAVISQWLAYEDDCFNDGKVQRRLYCFDNADQLFQREPGGSHTPSIAAVLDPLGEGQSCRGERSPEPREIACGSLQDLHSSSHPCWVPAVCSGVANGVAAATGQYLIHCTRGRQGCFADQSPAGYAAELLLCEEDLEPSPLETLVRIIRSGRIAATSLLKREAAASVSFADVPLTELLSRRSYQPHLRRWDWEPYGLAICRGVLQKHFAARPVQYLSPKEYQHLPKSERWLFQPAVQTGGRDWTTEREWRCTQDVRLSKLDFADALVFVATQKEAAMLQRISRFAVLAAGQL